MKREIKFRAWDKKGKQMINYIAELRFNNNYLSSIKSEYDLDILNGQNSGNYERLENEIILMQFTGLEDKNGKEIFEGDILYFLGATKKILPVDFSNNHGFKMHNKGFTHYSIYRHEVKIIGNIYENPELLK